ncbi:copper resistance protein CopC [Actinoplanes sp. NEAU-A12]|uniref:Copper resistance protein CopC n=1 Tax=Actinoplanes sandaracinus TaxID=3045177 RepID=A0ABT6WR93_9ACTN|nr:copper resistance protein CopC [Actinoplanes sandaracinus]MDI6102262.1 copper resistance protein CopC [Actinoplanes sandaracinus]
MIRVLLFLSVLLTTAVALPAAPAAAHAAPVGSNPAPGSVIGASPTEVTVTFSEPVAPVPGNVQVIAPDGERISGKATVEGTTVRIPVRKAKKPLGTYLISFRVISADSHPVGGAITFSVGGPSARPEAPAASTGTHPSVAVAVPLFRTIGYGGLTLIAGPALFLAFLWPRRRDRRGALRLIRVGLGLTAASALAAIGLQSQQGSGAALWQVTGAELTEVLTSQFGLLLVARLTVLGALAVLLPPLLRRPERTVRVARTVPEPVLVGAGAAEASAPSAPAPALSTPPAPRPRPHRVRVAAVLLLAVAGLTTWPLTGHAIAVPLPAVTVVVGVVHMAAMAVWLGGLITLTGFLLRRTEARVLGVILPVWSRWAALSVIWLVVAGAVQSVVQLGSLPALWQTGYGRLLLVKLGILAVVLAAAAGARRMVTSRRSGSGLRWTVGIEVAATTVILALSSVLVQVDPGRSGAKQSAITGKGFSETLTSDLYTVQFNIYPVELGEYNTVHAFLYKPDGAPLTAEEWEVSARLLDPSLEAVKQPMAGLIPGNQALGSLSFPLPGTYEVTFTIRVSEIDRATVKTTVKVAG